MSKGITLKPAVGSGIGGQSMDAADFMDETDVTHLAIPYLCPLRPQRPPCPPFAWRHWDLNGRFQEHEKPELSFGRRICAPSSERTFLGHCEMAGGLRGNPLKRWFRQKKARGARSRRRRMASPLVTCRTAPPTCRPRAPLWNRQPRAAVLHSQTDIFDHRRPATKR